MRRSTNLTRYVLASLLVAACGDGIDPDPDAAPATPATEADIATYHTLVDQVSAAASTYQSAMADPALTVESCATAHSGYELQVRPAIGGMLGMADELDRFMDQHDGAFNSDLTCTARAMMDELDDHNHVACMWPDLARDRAESTRHLDLMIRYTDHADQRCQEMLAGMAGHGWEWGPLVGCQ